MMISSISNFLEKNQNFGFPCCSTFEDLSIDVSITNVGLIFDEARVISYLGGRTLGVRTKFNFKLFEKIQNFGSLCCSTREDLPIDVSITNVGLILMKLR